MAAVPVFLSKLPFFKNALKENTLRLTFFPFSFFLSNSFLPPSRHPEILYTSKEKRKKKEKRWVMARTPLPHGENNSRLRSGFMSACCWYMKKASWGGWPSPSLWPRRPNLIALITLTQEAMFTCLGDPVAEIPNWNCLNGDVILTGSRLAIRVGLACLIIAISLWPSVCVVCGPYDFSKRFAVLLFILFIMFLVSCLLLIWLV